MQTDELLVTVSAAGGQLWLEGDKLRARLPESLRPMVDVLREHKGEIIELLAQCPPMPPGVRLIRWAPLPAPVKINRCMTVTNTRGFIDSTLRQLEARLRGDDWGAGNWSSTELLARLEACGCVVELENRKLTLQ